MPDGYGVPESDDGLLAWADVEARLVESPQYWLATTRPDGRPHVVPRWGVWLDGGLFYDGAPTTRHVRNLTTNQACTLHLEDGWHAVVVEGTSSPRGPHRSGDRSQVRRTRLLPRTRLLGRRGRRWIGALHPDQSHGMVRLPHRRHPVHLRLGRPHTATRNRRGTRRFRSRPD